MNKIINATETLVKRIAKTAGFSNDPTLMNGKLGVVILLFHGSKFFQSDELEQIARFLIDDIIEEKDQIIKSSEAFWTFHYLSEMKFIELDKDFFTDIDEAMFGDTNRVNAMNHPFLGIYILSRYASDKAGFWIDQIPTYVGSMLRLSNLRKGFVKRNLDQFAPFWYVMHKCKELNISIDINKKELREVRVIFDEIFREAPEYEKSTACFQFYSLYKNQDFRYKQSWIGSIKEINNLYLNRLLYPGYIMPPPGRVKETIEKILNDKRTLQELVSLFSYQNIGISGYISGFAWTLMSYLQYEN